MWALAEALARVGAGSIVLSKDGNVFRGVAGRKASDKVGDRLGYTGETGYVNITMYERGQALGGSRKYGALGVHRLMWEVFVGSIPEGWEIDHLNGVRGDNRLENLSCVPPGVNQTRGLAKRPRRVRQDAREEAERKRRGRAYKAWGV